MGFSVVMKLKDSPKKRIVIKRGDQKFIGVNQEIKDKIKQSSVEGESYAETINRVVETSKPMNELLTTLVQNLESTPTKMTEVLSILPESLHSLFNQLRKKEKEE